MSKQVVRIGLDVDVIELVRVQQEPEAPANKGRKRRSDAGKPRKQKAKKTDDAASETTSAPAESTESKSTSFSRPNGGRFMKVPVEECDGAATIVGPKGRYIVVVHKSGESKKGLWAIALFLMKDRKHAYHRNGGFWIDDLKSLELPDDQGEWTVKGMLLPMDKINALCELVYPGK